MQHLLWQYGQIYRCGFFSFILAINLIGVEPVHQWKLGQYQTWWCSGSLCLQAIARRDIDYV